MTASGRELLLERLYEDLVGPDASDEVLRDKPSDRYLTGILFPQRLDPGADEDERLEISGGGDDEDSPPEDVPSASLQKPAAAGLSFGCASDEGDCARVSVRVTGGMYVRAATHSDPSQDVESESEDNAAGLSQGEPGAAADGKGSSRRVEWRRRAVQAEKELTLRLGEREPSVPLDELPGFHLYVTTARSDYGQLVTAVLVNDNEWTPEGTGLRPDEMTLFQMCVEVRPAGTTRFISRPVVADASDDDSRSAQLLYRDVREYAVGHTCSATWDCDSVGRPTVLRTTWIPVQDVDLVSADGGNELQSGVRQEVEDPLLAATLLNAGDEIADRLRWLPNAYGVWISGQRRRADDPTDVAPAMREQALTQLARCDIARERIEEGISLLAADRDVRAAFRLMTAAMVIQRRWTEKGGDPFRWRPFQLAFLLQSLESVANPASRHRRTMDLLWFPTGGGKTEAYLGLIAFNLFLRRIRRIDEGDRGGGVTCIMRYTLRLLTLQQFERAAALTLACEYVRRGMEQPSGTPDLSRAAEVSVGLWVGSTATPNSFQDAIDAANGVAGKGAVEQLTECPCCASILNWTLDLQQRRIVVTCSGEECELSRAVPEFPILTVDQLIYRTPPTLLFGTIDKFAQILRSKDAPAIFNRGVAPPPDLIIQDELHLISGPLGTVSAVYEIAVDLICSREGFAPKIIGSTATIRRADEQIRALFDRSSSQFPPPGIDATDSCFAAVPDRPKTRRYVGISTAGRSAKFTLQAVYASLLQAASQAGDDEIRDGYHTSVGYFNSLRELGGAVVLTQDDVRRSLRLLARRRGESRREAREVVELTSRVSQREIRELLDRLKKPFRADGSVDVVLATNMISVGVDVSRLSLMVVMGQPKTISEYIQATSRVGRSKNEGLVVTILNSAKARDRSHFESFRSWHSALYRGVEATSVTPFASRSRDRALHAALLAAARHLVPGLADTPQGIDDHSEEVAALSAEIVERARRIDDQEAKATATELRDIVRKWKQGSARLTSFWEDHRPASSLLISAERATSRLGLRTSSRPWPTLNSMRNVEAGTPFRLIEHLGASPDETNS